MRLISAILWALLLLGFAWAKWPNDSTAYITCDTLPQGKGECVKSDASQTWGSSVVPLARWADDTTAAHPLTESRVIFLIDSMLRAKDVAETEKALQRKKHCVDDMLGGWPPPSDAWLDSVRKSRGK